MKKQYPRDAKKADLYDYIQVVRDKSISELKNELKKEIPGDVDEFAENIVSEHLSVVRPFVDALNKAKELGLGAMKKPDGVTRQDVHSSPIRTGLEHSYYIFNMISNILTDGITTTTEVENRVIAAVTRTVDDFKLVSEETFFVRTSQLKEKVEEYNKIAEKFSEESDNIRTTSRTLTAIVSNASRGSDAWNKLVAAGFDLKPLEARLLRENNTSKSDLPSTVIAGIETLNNTASGLTAEKEDNKNE